MITLKVDDHEVLWLLEEGEGRLEEMTPAMKEVEVQMEAAVMKNFRAQGRPTRWTPSKRANREGARPSGRAGASGTLSSLPGAGTGPRWAPTWSMRPPTSSGPEGGPSAGNG